MRVFQAVDYAKLFSTAPTKFVIDTISSSRVAFFSSRESIFGGGRGNLRERSERAEGDIKRERRLIKQHTFCLDLSFVQTLKDILNLS